MGCKLGKPPVEPISDVQTDELETVPRDIRGEDQLRKKPHHNRRRFLIDRASKRSYENTSGRQNHMNAQNSQSSLGSRRSSTGSRESGLAARRGFDRGNSQGGGPRGLQSASQYNSVQTITAAVEYEDSDPDAELEGEEEAEQDEEVPTATAETSFDRDVCAPAGETTKEVEEECEPTNAR
eukprot:gb/GECG01006471.1/.p1 GENE.gb/GECG01006471.1/~~gb/GECG01006471.1/.p1  ORF type:complete len:181 (+),score=28.42 gb/GECG01006471.1/:1-543(+)